MFADDEPHQSLNSRGMLDSFREPTGVVADKVAEGATVLSGSGSV